LFAGFLRIIPGKVDFYGPTDHEEAGIVVTGKSLHKYAIILAKCLTWLGVLDLEDENGKKASLHQGESFFIRRGSRIIFSTTRFAVVFKCSSYAAGLGKEKEMIR
jgi:hypothetical protein